METTPLTKKIEKTITPAVEAMGFAIVRVLLIGSGKPTLQIMAERISDGAITLDECSKVSQAISAILDVERTMETAYFLEVSSPGIDRPLTRLKDFDRYKNLEAKIEIEPAIENRKRFRGILKGIEGETVLIEDTDTKITARIPFSSIRHAKLLLTDELLKAAQQKKAS